ncbi:unnamed protein product [Cuscuta epithymum]|uniref:Reverse transcriptase zinc-binding domain-containing protein n=1 Tax=Cuscuta epithymum TaxID=186058 RepID=A0AAV0D489_9ASTE|nr:unnamed protein product [Cuscuta epithymum]
MTGTLPTADKLWERRVDISGACRLCKEAEETSIHLFNECRVVIEVWQKAGKPVQRHDTSVEEWVKTIFSSQTEDDICKFLTMLWSIWKARNELIWKNKHFKADHVGIIGLQGWRAVRTETNKVVGVNEGGSRWSKPEHNVIKINVDAATDARRGRRAWG